MNPSDRNHPPAEGDGMNVPSTVPETSKKGARSRRADFGEAGEQQGDQPDHVGATEDQVSRTPAPAGKTFKDEPKQG